MIPVIYKRDANGRIRTWTYEVEDDKWRSIAGLMDGEKVVSGWTHCTPKSQDTAEAQAKFEAEAERKKKLDRDYRETLCDVDRPRSSMIKPMLAQKFEGMSFVGQRVASQPKLDGIRCIATIEGLWSRQGKPILGCPHILEALQPVWEIHPNMIFDGELYNHELKDDFNTITSIVKKQRPTEEELQRSREVIQYHIYDLPSYEDAFSARYRQLAGNIPAGPSIHLVQTTWVNEQGALDVEYGRYLEEGYEGQMVRLDGFYEQKRSKLLLKRKTFVDDEFPVVSIEEGIGNWAGYAKRATLLLPDGREFGAGIKGNQQFTRSLLNGPKPSTATIRFFAYTPDGVPRFPVAVTFHEGERVL